MKTMDEAVPERAAQGQEPMRVLKMMGEAFQERVQEPVVPPPLDMPKNQAAGEQQRPGTQPAMSERTLAVGPDRVIVTAERVLIQAKHEMPEWEVYELFPVPIYFEDKKYYLVETRPMQGPHTICYVLRRWPEKKTTTATNFHVYDANSVAEREANLRNDHLETLVRACLIPLFPLLGFVWSGAQRRLGRFCFAPRTITGISIFTSFCLFFGQGVFSIIMLNGSLRSGQLMLGGFLRAATMRSHFQIGAFALPVAWVDYGLLVIFLVDAAMRYTFYLREDQWYGGMLEWLVRKKPDEEE
jgi:hypothetical protein